MPTSVAKYPKSQKDRRTSLLTDSRAEPKKEECGEISAKRSQAGAKGGKKSSQLALKKKTAQWEARLKKLHLTENAGRPQNHELLYEGDTRKGFDFSNWASDVEEKTKAARENGEWPISLT
jgi:hypothetical protein